MPTFEPGVDKPDQPHLRSAPLKEVKGEPIERVGRADGPDARVLVAGALQNGVCLRMHAPQGGEATCTKPALHTLRRHRRR
jgi:hypothetical protein